MNEFARMLYQQWAKDNERDIFGAKGKELLDELEKILSSSLMGQIYDTFCDGCLEIEEAAFIAGFGYACKCLSDGKIDLNGGTTA